MKFKLGKQTKDAHCKITILVCAEITFYNPKEDKNC